LYPPEHIEFRGGLPGVRRVPETIIGLLFDIAGLEGILELVCCIN
jgi:hypothetical protein